MLLAGLTRTEEELSRKVEERRRRFDAVLILQATLRIRDGTTRRVAVSKPTDEIGYPHIGELFYAALEDYPVLVVDRRRRVVARMPTAATGDIML